MQSRRFSYACLFTLALLCLVSLSNAKTKTSLYDSSKSRAFMLNRDNFDKQITKFRAKQVAVVHYYRYDDSGSETIAPEFDKFAEDWQGVFRIGAVDCFAQYELCEKEGIQNLPVVKIYPILPVPSFDYEGDMSAKGWTGSAARFVQSNVLELNSTNFQKFISDNPSVPKALLFTDKPGFPLIYKALSVTFEKKIFLGIVRSEQSDIVSKYNVKKYPTILMIRPHDKKTFTFSGNMKYGEIFDFMNIYTETFVPGGENLDFDKPWNKENFPEMHKKSANDICFDKDGLLCGIYLTKTNPETDVVNVINELMVGGINDKYRYMWLNVDTQQEFAKIFAVEEIPKLVILSHGKRKKYLIHDGELTQAAILNTLEKIINGDARFKHIPGDLPSLN